MLFWYVSGGNGMLFVTAVLFGLLLLHPYFLYPLSLRLFRARPISFQSGGVRPSATLVFCAYNEAASVPDKVANLRAIKALYPELRFRAYVDQSTDNTLELLQQHSDILDVYPAAERTGKAVGMRQLAAVSDTEIMIFTDANVTVKPDTIGRMLDYFGDPEVGGVCGTLIYTNADESTTASANSVYWRIEEYIKKNETRCGSTMGADGSLFATRRRFYPEVPSHLLDDFIVSMSIVFAGKRLISAPDVIAYERSAASSGDEFRRKRRIACRAYSSHRFLVPKLRGMSALNRYKYISHRLIRWYGAAWGLLSVGLGLLWIEQIGGLEALLAAVAALAVLLLFALKGGVRKLRWLGELARALWATMLGVVDSLRGKRYQTWQPAQTR